MSSKKPPVSQLYSKYLVNEKNRTGLIGEQAENLWGFIPITLGEAAKHAMSKKVSYDSDRLEDLKKELKKNNKKLGILTNETKENIERLHEGVIETGQQPNCLGGPSLVINKIICTEAISKQSNLVPFFSIVDYDGVRGELTNTRLPSLAPEGLLIQYPVKEKQLETPIYTLENPPETWLNDVLEKTVNNYKSLIRNHSNKEIFHKNLSQIKSLLKYSYFSTENVSNLSTKILGTILNIEGNAAIPFCWYSMLGTRKIFQQAYEDLLAEPTRTQFIQNTNKAVENIESIGYHPQRGSRKNDYVPFYIECNKCRKRLEPHYHKNNGSSNTEIKTKCPNCGESQTTTINSSNPDLSEIIEQLSPRVDTRQLIVNSVIPVVLRVGGSGENGYFAEIQPVARALKRSFPAFYQYTRVFYNTPWNTEKAKSLAEKECKALQNPILYNSLGRWVEARNQNDPKKYAAAHKMIQYAVFSTYNELRQKEKELHKEIEELRAQLRETSESSTLVNEINTKKNMVREISQYLSWAYGRYNSESFGQEVSWNWIDVAIISGIDNVADLYRRIYNEHTPNQTIFYVNL